MEAQGIHWVIATAIWAALILLIPVTGAVVLLIIYRRGACT